MNALPAVTRPNGALYRPRKIVAQPCGEEEGEIDSVYVFGTHDVERARALADRAIADWIDYGYCAGDARLTWIRDTFEGGYRRFVHDEENGRAAVRFEVDDRIELERRAGTPGDDEGQQR